MNLGIILGVWKLERAFQISCKEKVKTSVGKGAVE